MSCSHIVMFFYEKKTIENNLRMTLRRYDPGCAYYAEHRVSSMRLDNPMELAQLTALLLQLKPSSRRTRTGAP